MQLAKDFAITVAGILAIGQSSKLELSCAILLEKSSMNKFFKINYYAHFP
jgi:hypothetical protein